MDREVAATSKCARPPHGARHSVALTNPSALACSRQVRSGARVCVCECVVSGATSSAVECGGGTQVACPSARAGQRQRQAAPPAHTREKSASRRGRERSSKLPRRLSQVPRKQQQQHQAEEEEEEEATGRQARVRPRPLGQRGKRRKVGPDKRPRRDRAARGPPPALSVAEAAESKVHQRRRRSHDADERAERERAQ